MTTELLCKIAGRQPFNGKIIQTCTFSIGEETNDKGEKEYYIVNSRNIRIKKLNNLRQGEILIQGFE